jgi:NTE family protein
MAVREGDEEAGRATRGAFVLAGGGGLAAGQAGMLRALSEAGVVPDLVIGSSAGALNAVAYASDPTAAGLERMESMWVAVRRRTVFPLSLARLLAAAAGRGDGIVSSAALRAVIERGQVVSRLTDTVIPAHVVVTDLGTGAATVRSAGDSVSALLASSAFPGVFPPVKLDGRLFIDGGVAAETPVLQAEALGATVSYILPSAAPSALLAPRGAAPLALHALNHLLLHASHGDLAAARGQVHLLPAPAAATSNPLAFRDARRLIDEGYRLASDWLRGERPRAGLAAAAQVIPAPSPVLRAMRGAAT